MAAEKLFTRSEIQKNKELNKVMIVLHDRVFNVQNFLNEHPGGEEVLLDQKGKDASESFDDVGHSSDAMELMKQYQIGMLVESERKNQSPKKGWIAGYGSMSDKKQGSRVPLLSLYAGGFVILIAVLYYLI